jgi:hypothetical protein
MSESDQLSPRELAERRWHEMLDDGLITPDEHARGLNAIAAGYDPAAWIHGQRVPLI